MIHDVVGEGETEVMTKVHAASVHESLTTPRKLADKGVVDSIQAASLIHIVEFQTKC
jgi:hypothetical protein